MQFVLVDLFKPVMTYFLPIWKQSKNLINIEFPGVSWQSTGSFMISFLQNCLFIIFLFFDSLYFEFWFFSDYIFHMKYETLRMIILGTFKLKVLSTV